MCPMSIDGINVGLLPLAIIAIVQAAVLLAFPAKARAFYIWSHDLVGVRVNAKSPLLSDAGLQFIGIATLVFLGLVLLVAWSAAGGT